MKKPVRPLLGESAASRVQTRRAALIEKAFEWIASDRWKQGSISRLCREAELNKRYFYESFESLDELESAVIDGLVTELIQLTVRESTDEAAAKLDTEALASKVLVAAFTWFEEDSRRAHVLFRRSADNEKARSHRRAVVDQMARALSTFGLQYHQPRTGEPAVEVAHEEVAKLSSALLVGGTIEVVMSWLEGRLSLSKEDLALRVAKLWVAVGNESVAIALDRSEG